MSSNWRRAAALAVAIAPAVAAQRSAAPPAPSQQPRAAPTTTFFIGVVVLSELTQGEENSASVVTDPQKYQDTPALRVVAAEIPRPPSDSGPAGNQATLGGVVVDMGDGRKQPGDRPLTWIPPLTRGLVMLSVWLGDRPEKPIATANLPIEKAPPAASGAAPSPDDGPSDMYQMPSVGSPGATQVIRGRSSGDSTKMRIAVDDTPATIIAARPGLALWDVPGTIAAGLHRVAWDPGTGRPSVTLPLCVLEIKMSADRMELMRGQSTRLHIVVSGPEQLPEASWQSASPAPELVDMKKLEQRAAGFHGPKPSDPGVVLLVIENKSPATIRLGRGSAIVLQLHRKDFAAGPYAYDDTIQSIKSGTFGIDASATAFLKESTAPPNR